MKNQLSTTPNEESVRSAYLYMLGRILAIRQEHTDIAKTPYNTIKYNPLGSDSADFVNPNLDVAYLETWIAVDDTHAVILNVPKVKDRYYTVQVMDGWGEVITNVNERNFPQHPFGKIAFVKNKTSPAVPSDALVVYLPSAKAKLLARVELSTSPQEALALQQAFTLDVPAGIKIEAAPPLPDDVSGKFPGAWIFENVDAILASCPDSMPDAPKLQQIVRDVAAYMSTGEAAKATLQDMIDNQVVPYFYSHLINGRPARGGWAITNYGGRFGNHYDLRALVNFGGIWANVPEEAIYYTTHNDVDGNALSGNNTYMLHFPADALPESASTAFWSVTMLRLPDYRVVPNPLNRFSINNISGTKLDADGSLTLYMGPELPDNVPSENWLPAPKDTPIILTMRLYVPRQNAMDQEWFVPALVPVK